jgi:hypothetical protein
MSVKTLCKNCSFEHEPLECFVGRIDKLKMTPGVSVGEEDGHYVVEGKICDWAVPLYNKNLSKIELRDLAWKVRENRILKIPFIVVTQKGSTLTEISATIRSLQNQQVEPEFIHVINYSDVPPLIVKNLQRGSNVPITVEQVYLDDFVERYTWNKIQKINNSYYGLINAGDTIPSSFIRKIDQEFNDQMNHFVYLEYGNIEIHATLLSLEKGGDFIETSDGYRYKDKVLAWCSRNNLENLIQRWDNI